MVGGSVLWFLGGFCKLNFGILGVCWGVYYSNVSVVGCCVVMGFLFVCWLGCWLGFGIGGCGVGWFWVIDVM